MILSYFTYKSSNQKLCHGYHAAAAEYVFYAHYNFMFLWFLLILCEDAYGFLFLFYYLVLPFSRSKALVLVLLFYLIPTLNEVLLTYVKAFNHPGIFQ